MKNILLWFTLLLLVSCNKETWPPSEAVITARDYNRCWCCGGWYIEIHGKTYHSLLSNEIQTQLNLSEETLPVKVRLKWERSANSCRGDQIDVGWIELR